MKEFTLKRDKFCFKVGEYRFSEKRQEMKLHSYTYHGTIEQAYMHILNYSVNIEEWKSARRALIGIKKAQKEVIKAIKESNI